MVSDWKVLRYFSYNRSLLCLHSSALFHPMVRWASLPGFCTEMEEKCSHGQRWVSVIKCQTLCPKNSTSRELSLPKDSWLTSAALLIRGDGLGAKAAWTACELRLMLRLQQGGSNWACKPILLLCISAQLEACLTSVCQVNCSRLLEDGAKG